MHFFAIQPLTTERAFLLAVLLTLSTLTLGGLFVLLRSLINKQVNTQVKEFADDAKIPKFIRKKIGVKIKWR